MGHDGKHNTIKKLPNMVDGVPKLLSKNSLYQYPHCLTSKASKYQLTIELISNEVVYLVACDTSKHHSICLQCSKNLN